MVDIDTVKAILSSDRYAISIQNSLKWLVAQQNDDGSYGKPVGTFFDLAGYYKSCYAFARAGVVNSGEKLIGFLEKHFHTEMGELLPSSGLARSEFWVYQNLAWYYMNSWICAGAWLLGHHDMALRIADGIARNQDRATGGVFSMRNGETKCLDIGTTCSAANAFLTCGQIDRARRAGDFLVQMLEIQPDPDILYLIMSHEDGRLLTNDHPRASLISPELITKREVNARQSNQEYWAPGMSMGVLGKLYRVTNDERYLETARKYFKFIRRCQSDVKASMTSGKLGWGCAVLFAITGEKEFLEYTSALTEYLLREQLEEGPWLYNMAFSKLEDQPYAVTLDMTSEMAIWLMEYRAAVLSGSDPARSASASAYSISA